MKTNDPKRRPRVGNVNAYVPRAVQDDLPGRGVRPQKDGRPAERSRDDMLHSGVSTRPQKDRRQGKQQYFGSQPKPAFRPAEASVQPEAVSEERVRAAAPYAEEELPENLLVGRNPIREALRSGRPMEKLLYAKGDLSGAAMEIISMAREAGVVVQEVDRTRLDQIYKNHQGIVAYVSAAKYSTVDDIFALAESKGEPPLFVLMDGVTDPHNLGAVIRSAECLGAHGVIIPERRAVGLTPAAVKTAAGAAEYVPVARVKNLTRAVEELQQRGVWVYAADMDGESVYDMRLDGAMAVVIGSEGEGVSRLVGETCDGRIMIPMYGSVNSLNASVAAGIILSEIAHARRS